MSKEILSDQHVPRRDFFRYLGMGALRTSGVVALNTVAFGIQELKARADWRKYEEEKLEYTENGQDLKVKHFAEEIVGASKRITSYKGEDELKKAVFGWFVGDSIGGYSLRNKPDLLKKGMGVLSLVAGKAIDVVSTLVAVRNMEDPRFEEYGLNLYIGEQNPLFSVHPSRRELVVKSALLAIPGVFAGWRFPSFGRGYAVASPFIAETNYKYAHIILTSLKIGDGIKSLIEEGRDKDYIQNFLQELQEY